jgi:hypothetical protein
MMRAGMTITKAGTQPTAHSPQHHQHQTTMTTLNLNPWKDGTEFTWSLLEQHPERIKTVRIQFDEKELKQDVAENDLVAIFEGVGSELPNLEHLHVHLQISIQSPLSSRAFPPINGLTSLLMEANRLKSLSLIGLALLGGDYEMRGLVESLRIHPSLQCFEMKDCSFSNKNHLQNLRGALANIPSLKHSDLLNNAIARAPIQHTEEEQDCHAAPSWVPPSLSWLLCPIVCCQ